MFELFIFIYLFVMFSKGLADRLESEKKDNETE